MNHLIGQKIAITSNKPQNEEKSYPHGLKTEEGQIVQWISGFPQSKNKLGESMVTLAERS
jgi:GTPase